MIHDYLLEVYPNIIGPQDWRAKRDFPSWAMPKEVYEKEEQNKKDFKIAYREAHNFASHYIISNIDDFEIPREQLKHVLEAVLTGILLSDPESTPESFCQGLLAETVEEEYEHVVMPTQDYCNMKQAYHGGGICTETGPLHVIGPNDKAARLWLIQKRADEALADHDNRED
jgi:hypothetical protein